jgi:uncharacterized membrane protein (UPF0182 family)
MRTRASHRRPVTRRPATPRDGCDDSAPRRAPRARRAWWWQPRTRSALLLGALAVAALLARIAAHAETEWLWFHELGQQRVFWTLIASRWLAGGLAGLGTTAFLLANLWFAERTAPAEGRLPGGRRTRTRLWRILLPAQIGVSAVAGLAVGRSVVLSDWQHLVLWLHRRDFGVTDPLFHKDIGFFVFSLPLYEQVAQWLLLTTGIALAYAFAAHAATGGIRTKPSPLSATRAAYAHVLGLGALLLVLVAWQHRLSQFALELPRRGETVPGAGYTAVHVQLPWLHVLVVVALAAAAMFVYAAVRRSWSVPAVAVAMVAVAELVNPAVLPSVVQRFVVEPQTLSRERPYIAQAMAFTRRAYALDGVAERPLPANATISDRELRANRDVIGNIQLWDTDVLRPEIAQQQAIGSYYGFPNITVDRYSRGGQPEGMIVAERELDLSRLAPAGRTWANDRLAYSHGYGLVAVPAGDAGVDDQGKPRFVTSEFGAGRPPAELREPRVYYGVQPRRAQPWVVVRTQRPEVEKPLSGDSPPPDYHYSGGAGIPMSDAWRRALFALRFGDLNLLLSETLGPHPRILLHRDVADRLRNLAPFLHWERRPEVAVVGGRITFLAHGYTTSNSYPYSERTRVDGTELNYLRASALATVDAFNGRVTMYPTDTGDPIIRAWEAAFPTLFTPVERMPSDVRAHLRYPRALFSVQSRIWAAYHIRNVDDFYIKADAWKRPAAVSGPIQKVGDRRARVRSNGRNRGLRPDFVLARLPGRRRQQFMLTTMFTPYSEENLSGYLTGTLDGRGRPSLTQLSLPRSRRVLGPSQVSRQILASPGVSGRLRLLNQETTDLGEQSVNIVEIGDPRVVPIGDSFLYVQSIYVSARGTGATRLRLVTVFLNGRVGYGESLDDALRSAGATPSLRRSAVRARPDRLHERGHRPALRGKDVHRQR